MKKILLSLMLLICFELLGAEEHKDFDKAQSITNHRVIGKRIEDFYIAKNLRLIDLRKFEFRASDAIEFVETIKAFIEKQLIKCDFKESIHLIIIDDMNFDWCAIEATNSDGSINFYAIGCDNIELSKLYTALTGKPLPSSILNLFQNSLHWEELNDLQNLAAINYLSSVSKKIKLQTSSVIKHEIGHLQDRIDSKFKEIETKVNIFSLFPAVAACVVIDKAGSGLGGLNGLGFLVFGGLGYYCAKGFGEIIKSKYMESRADDFSIVHAETSEELQVVSDYYKSPRSFCHISLTHPNPGSRAAKFAKAAKALEQKNS